MGLCPSNRLAERFIYVHAGKQTLDGEASLKINTKL
jgi:hypothetical protein